MDYNATTPCEPEVVEAITDALLEAWGNPSSGYAAGKKQVVIPSLGPVLLIQIDRQIDRYFINPVGEIQVSLTDIDGLWKQISDVLN